jgi:hypothetical protein
MEVAVVAAIHRPLAEVEPRQQIVCAHPPVVTHHRTEIAMVGLDQQTEHLHRHIRSRPVEIHEDLADDGMKQ